MELFRSAHFNPVLVFLLALACSAPARALTVGPVYNSLPGGFSFTQTGDPDDTLIGRASGKEITHYNMPLADLTTVYLVIPSGGVKGSMNGTEYTGAEIMTLAGISLNTSRWTGSTTIVGAPVATVFNTRGTEYGTAAGVTSIATSAITGIPDGGAAYIVPTAGINLWMQMLGNGEPFYDYYDRISTSGGSAGTSVSWEFYYVNVPPTISDIADQTTSEDTSSGPHAFTVDDAEMGLSGTLDSLIITATSSDQTIVSDADITLGGSTTANRTITLVPEAGQAGTTTITLTVTDDNGESASDTFDLFVSSLPTISDITDKITPIDTASGPHDFTVGDTETPPGLLVVTASSSDTTLVPNANIALGGSDANRTITLYPVSGKSGTTVITVSVTDEHGGSASDSFTLVVNAPPQLTANNGLTLDRGTSAVIDNTLLAATDDLTAPEDLTFSFGDVAVIPRNGVLLLDGIPLGSADTFTQADIDADRLSYSHDGSCNLSDDFAFDVSDEHGGMAPPPPYMTYNFKITVSDPNRPPVAVNDSLQVPIGAPTDGVLQATDDNCTPPTFTFSIETQPSHGAIVLNDPNLGTYTYTPNTSKAGLDSFTFQVSDGTAQAAVAGAISIEISNVAPSPVDGLGETGEDTPYSGVLTATDPDLPPQMLTYSIDTNGSKGTAVIDDPAAGTFTYTPAPGAIGTASFTFIANDGFVDSSAGTFTIEIRPKLEFGDLIVSDARSNALILVDPVTGHQALLSQGGYLSEPHGITIQSNGMVLVTDGAGAVVQVDPVDGSQRELIAAVPFPFDVAVDDSGAIYVSSGDAGVTKFDAAGTQLDVFSGGDLDFAAGLDAIGSDLYVTSAGGFVGQSNKLVRIDLVTGVQTLVSADGLLTFPVGMEHNPADNPFSHLYIANAGPLANLPDTNVIAIDTMTGTEAIFSTGPLVSLAIDVTFSLTGKGYAVNADGSVISLNSVGDPTLISSGEYLIEPWAIEVINSYGSVCNLGPLVIDSGVFDPDLGAVELASEDSIIVRGADVLSLADVILRAPWISFEVGYQFITEADATFHAIAESVDCATRALAHRRTPTLPQATEVRP